MKQENNKKSKLWLWLVIGLVALLAVAGVVLALLLPGQQNDNTDAVDAELYWNIDGAYYLSISDVPGFSGRTAAADGKYYITFAYQGQQVEKQIADKQLVNFIDNMTVAGLIFDANGVVVDAVSPETVATETAKDFYVQKVDGNTVILNSSRALNGMNLELTLTDATGIYDVTDKAEFVGAPGQLDIMDRVLIYSDLAEENVTHVYILEHPVDAGIYWRVERLYDAEAKITTRVPDENGVYTIEFAHEGEIVELKCKDPSLVSSIDSRAILSGQFAFLFDEDGYIVEMADIAMALRGKQMAADYHITAIEGDTYTATRISSGSDQGKTVTFTLAQDCDVFQVCQFGCYDHHCGERVDSLQMLDRVNIYGNVDDEAVLIFVTRRIVEDDFYYNYNRQYGGAEKGTNRTKQSDGYYHFELLLDGKVKTVRAKKELADQMDAITSGCMGLKLNGNVVERVYNAGCVTGGSELGAVVTMRSGPVLTLTSAYSGNSWNVMMSGDCKIYNAMTGEYGKEVGGTAELMVGDNVMTFRDHANEACIIFVRSRAVEGAKVYYNLTRKWSNEKQETTRVPNEEGYYEFLMACEGKQVTVKTKSKGMASFIDQQLAPMAGLKVNKSGVITNAYSVESVISNSGKACNYRYVENVTKSTFNTYYFPGNDLTKKTVDATTWNIAKDCKVYNVSTAFAQFRGEKSTLKNGDYIQAIRNYTTNEITQIFIMQRDPTYGVKSYKADCAHCGKNVTWQPYGGKDIPVADAHYFLCGDVGANQKSVGLSKEKDDKFCDIVLDLKGYTLTSTTRAFLVYDSLTIMDTKGGGKLVGTTPNFEGIATSGSCIMVGEGGKLNIMGGELTVSDKSTDFGQYGGVLYIGTDAQVTMSGGKIHGGTATTMGGNVAVLGGSFTMTGGVIENGTAPNGGCVRVNSGSFTMTGGTVDGEITKGTNAVVELSGAPIIKGAGLTVTAGTKLDVSKLSKDASVAVRATGIFTDVLENPDSWLNIIKPGAEGDKIIIKKDALCYIVSGPPSFVLDQDGDGMAVCPVCGGEEVAWTAVTAGERIGAGVSGHYYIKENVTSAYTQFATTTAKEHTLCIHLNGKTLTTSGRIATVGSGGTINIMGDGTLVGSGTANGGTDVYTDATLVANSSGSINLYDKVTVSTTAAGKPVVQVLNGANIKLYGNAKIQQMNGGQGIVIEKGKLTVNEGWNGSALVKFPTALTDGVVSKSNGASTGAFTGTLTLDAEGNPKLVALKGGLALEGVSGGPVEFVLDPDGDGKAVCPACGEDVYWERVAGGDRVGVAKTGHYYLAEDSTDPSNQYATTTAKEHKLCIHLNGKNLTTSGRIATVGSGGTINIMGQGTITGSGAYTGKDQDAYTLATLVANSGGTINLYEDVTVTTTAAGKPVVVALNNGKINLYGNATVKEMTGGEGIDIQKGVLTVAAGWNGSALVKFPAALVNGVVPAANGVSTGDFTGTLTLNAEGKPQLIAKNGGLALKDGSGGEEEPPVQEGGFVLDPDGDGKAVCPVCGGEEVQWTAVGAGEKVGSAKTGHFYLAGDGADTSAQYATTTAKEHKLCIHLNGKNLTTSGRIATVGSGGTINIMGKGTITGSGAYTGADQDVYTLATLVANSGGSINLYEDVTVTTTAAGKPVAVALNNGKINLYGNATVKEMTGGEGIDIQKGVLTVAAGWNGSALVKFPAALVEGVVPAANGVSTGDFTGTLTLNAEGKPQLIAKDGGLAVKEGSGGEEEPPVQEGGFVLDPDGDGKAVCPVCGGEEVAWTAVEGGQRLGAGKSGHYYLAEDSTDPSNQYATTTAKEHKLCIHLNGKNLTTSGRIATVGAGGTINIMGKGTITGSGAYTGADQDAYTLATLVANSGGTINLYEDVTVTTTAAGKPVVVALNNGKINLYGASTVIPMAGGEGIDIQKGVLTVAAGWSGSALVKFPAALVDGVVPAANGASTGDFTGILTLDAEGKPQLIAQNGGLAVKDETAGKLVLDADNNGYCEACGKVVQWTDINSLSNPRIGYLNSKPSGVAAGDYVISEYYHFFLSADLDYTSDVQFAERYYNVNCLHLNGHNLSVKARLRVGLGGTMNIMGSGSITGSCNSTNADYNQSLFYLNGGAVLNLYGGTYTSTNAEAPVVLLVDTKATTVNICGDVTVNGGVKANNGTVTLGLGAKVDTIELSNIAKVNVLSDWTGTASVKFATAYADGAEIPAVNGQCGALTDGVFTPGGSYTGNLFTKVELPQQITGKDGKLIVNPNHS